MWGFAILMRGWKGRIGATISLASAERDNAPTKWACGIFALFLSGRHTVTWLLQI
jgi:hypothetical protein